MTGPAPGNHRIPTVQSVVQLFEQMRHAGYAESELHRLRLAYGSAMALFAARMHVSGKPYIAHCVGAASALAACAAPADVVVAGLLHGAYRWGDFGAWRVLLPLRRAWLRQRVGVRTEEHVHAFHTLPWNLDALRAFSGRLADLDPLQRAAVSMRLASDLDNLRDRAFLYCADAEKRLGTLDRKGPLLIGLARELGLAVLAEALAAAVDERTPEVPAELRWRHGGGALMPPESSRRTPEAALGQALADLLRRVRRGASAGDS